MEKYLNLNHTSNVEAYEIEKNFIRVKFFKTFKIYTYSYNIAGQFHVEKMKILARNGSGLNSYIKKNVNNLYD
jgi:hypothetical protein